MHQIIADWPHRETMKALSWGALSLPGINVSRCFVEYKIPKNQEGCIYIGQWLVNSCPFTKGWGEGRALQRELYIQYYR